MIDTATVLARPDVIEKLRCVVRGAMISGGVADPHATRLSLSFAEKLAEGAPNVTAINLVDAIREILSVDIRAATLTEASNVVDRARAWAEGDLRGVRDRLRMMARDPKMVDRDEWDAAEEAADAEISALESQRENDGAGESGGLLSL